MATAIRTRLTAAYLLVLATATVLLSGGGWWLLRESMLRTADANLAARLEGTSRFITEVEREIPREELVDEFGEFAQLTSGDVLLEVVDERGVTLCAPLIPGWDALRVPDSPGGTRVFARVADGQPFRAVATRLAVGPHTYHVTAATPMKDDFAVLREYGWLLAGLVPTVLLLAAAGGSWISARAFSPVDRMTRDVQSISLQQLDQRLHVPPADDELGRLATTFNEMLARLQDSLADQVRFTAEAAHELRTPVSLARTTAEIALARDRSPSEYREALADVVAQTERMSRLVDDLLVLARADAGMESAPLDPVDLRDTVEESARVMRPIAARRALGFAVSLPDRPLVVSGSDESLKRLVLILLDNAMKYTPEGGAVTLRASERRTGSTREAVIDVSDTGAGIGAMDVPRVFRSVLPRRRRTPAGARWQRPWTVNRPRHCHSPCG